MTSHVKTTGDLDATLDRIMQELDAGVQKVPEQAIRDAQEHRDSVIPRLIQAIEAATASAAAGHVPEGNAHFFALFLLRDFQAKEALPVVVKAISLPGELPFDLFGDAITERLAGVLASLAADTPEVLDDLIADRSLNPYVRWEAAEAFLYLVRDGRLSRDRAVEQLQRHLHEAIINRDTDVVDFLILELTSYSPREALPDIEEAFRLDVVDEMMVDLDYVRESIEEGESRFKKSLDECRPTTSPDALDDLRGWAIFDERAEKQPARQAIHEERAPATWADEDVWDAPATIRNSVPRIGRNDPCPCGSGKKFKKCCGSV